MTRSIIPVLFLFLFVAALTDIACKKDEPSQPCTTCPPETTSHNFTWRIDTLGGFTSNVFYDVSIVNDSLIYAVGEFYEGDSTGNFDPQPYNLAIWDGKKWNPRKVPYYYQGQPLYNTLKSIWAFSEKNIWMGSGNMIHWDGQQYNTVELPAGIWGPYGLNKIWGDGLGFYIIGNQGAIARFDGSSWHKIQSPTSIDLQDIWGSVDPQTGNKTILAVGSERQSGNNYCVLQINGSTATLLDTTGLLPAESGVWFSPGSPYYVIGDWIFYKNTLSETKWEAIKNLTPYYIEKMRGNKSDDLVIAGDFGVILHYNGSSWLNYQNDGSLPILYDGAWLSVDMKGNTIAAVGYIGSRAATLIGVRQ